MTSGESPVSRTGFARLFKKYRLKSEFETLAEFGDVLAQKGLLYETSIFSHWQKGTRIPRDRNLLLIILRIFVERGGIATLKEANSFLASAHQGYITESELASFDQLLHEGAPFQVPREIQHFSGREQYITDITKKIRTGKHAFIYGSAGMGKTSLAIKIAHKLREDFPDGVLWYRLDTTKPEDILASIAYAYGQDISRVTNSYNRASLVRSLLADKRVLLIFDNAERTSDLGLLLPSGNMNGIVVTSQHEELGDNYSLEKLPLQQFNKTESFELFERILGKLYVSKHTHNLDELAALVGHLPLALTLMAKQLLHKNNLSTLLLQLKKQELELGALQYGEKNLYSSLEFSYKTLSKQEREVFVSLGIFDGEDFSVDAVAYIHQQPRKGIEKAFNALISSSLLEYSKKGRYRLHPVIKMFAQGIQTKPDIYSMAIRYYKFFLTKLEKRDRYYFFIQPEAKNIASLLEKSYDLGYYSDVIVVAINFLHFLWDTGSWHDMEKLGKLFYKATQKTHDVKQRALCCIEVFSWLYYWQGKVDLAQQYVHEAIKLSREIRDEYLEHYALQRLGRVLQGKRQFKRSLKYLFETSQYFQSIQDYRRLGNNFRYIAETYSLMGEYKEAKEMLYKAQRYLNKAEKSLIEVFQNIIDTHLGALSLSEGKYDEAESYFKDSLNIDEKYGTRTVGQMWNNIGLALVEEQKSQYENARMYFKTAHRSSYFFDLGSEIENRHVFVSILKYKIKESAFYRYFSSDIK